MKKIGTWLCWMFCSWGATQVLAEPLKIPPPRQPIVDEAGLLKQDTVDDLNQALIQLKKEGGSSIGVLVVPSLQGVTIEEFGIRVAESWQLGGAEDDDGVIVLLAPQEKQVRIEVGQGVEGEIPDALAKRIISEQMIPLFKTGDWDAGLMQGVLAIAKLTDPEFDLAGLLGTAASVDSNDPHTPVPRGRGFAWLFLLLILMLSFAERIFSPRRGIYRSRSRPMWTSGSGYGGFGSGSSGGGFGSGGFGSGGGSWGGGGGGFSGGGASGKW